jgi:glycine/sarcosine N-methyltransferase
MSDLYTDLAADYEWLFADEVVGGSPRLGATSPGGRDLVEAAISTLAPGAHVLDCACGVGADALALAQQGFTVTATDGSPSMIARARPRLAPYADRATVLQARWDELPQRLTERYDLAICLGNAIVHAGAGMAESLRAIREVLKPGATLIVDSRNWELIYSSWPRIVPAPRVIERRGTRCASFYIWTVPGRFDDPCQAEIVFLFENQAGELSHHRYELAFRPFTHAGLRQALESAGLRPTADSFDPARPVYAVAAQAA